MLAAPLPSRSHWHSHQDQPSTPGQHRSQKLPFSPLPQTRVVCCPSLSSPVSLIPLLRIELATNSCHHGAPSVVSRRKHSQSYENRMTVISIFLENPVKQIDAKTLLIWMCLELN